MTQTAWAPDGQELIVSAGGSVLVLSAVSGATTKNMSVDALILRVSPDGKWLATGTRTGSVRLWDRASAEPVSSVTTGSRLSALAFSADGTRLLAGAETADRRSTVLTQWRVAMTLEVVSETEVPGTEEGHLRLPDGRRFLAGRIS